MPLAAPRACYGDACGRRGLVRRGERWCPLCKTARSREDAARRGTAAERLYGSAWQRYRETYLKRHPLCVECKAGTPLPGGEPPTRITPATVVDHVRAHKGDRALFWEPTNHRAVCKPHHDARVDEGDFGRPAKGKA